MERIATVAERHGARIEIFVEALELAVLEEAGERHVRRAKKQLASLAVRGHGLQLHLHPQWDNAVRTADGWQLDDTKWRTGDLEAHDATRLVERGMEWIATIGSPPGSAARPTVFRAGGWCAQPAATLIPALQRAGIRADSSVAPGLALRDPGAWYEFRAAPRRGAWKIGQDVDRIGEGELYEIPIAVGRVNPLRHVEAIVRRRREGELAPGCHGRYRGAGLMQRLRTQAGKLATSRHAMLDFCSLPAELMMQVTTDWVDSAENDDLPVPIVAIGHTKNFSTRAEREFDRFAEWVAATPELGWSTYADQIERLDAKHRTE